MERQFRSVRYLSFLTLFTVFSLGDLAIAQVTVGYSSLTSVTGAAVEQSSFKQRTTDQYEISGVNVEPIDGGNTFDRNTVWKIYDQNNSWSLSVVDDRPKVDVSKEQASTKLLQAGRKESVYSTISGPLYIVIQQQTLSPFASVVLPPVVPISTSVFDDESASNESSSK
jgi:hypothetical protein